jgi:DNA-binding CsgD family transcriptional regulator
VRDVEQASVLRGSGEEFESALPYGVAEQLFRGDGRPVTALQTLGHPGDERGRTDVLAVGAEMVEAIGAFERDCPVALIVDDAHWADGTSLQALAFALRRLRDERVLAVVSTRDTVAERLPEYLQRVLAGELGVRLPLRGLSRNELRVFAAAVGVGALSPRVAARLHAHTGGNPLHARALFEELPAEELRDTTLPLPAPRLFVRGVIGRLARCSPETQRLVEAVSTLGICELGLAARVAEVDQPLEALDEAIRAHLLGEQMSTTGRMVTFAYPLLQAAVYSNLGPGRRSTLHARAAELVADTAAELHHRVAAAMGAETALAANVAASAGRLAVAGAWSAAADMLTTAARLSPDPSDRTMRLLEAVEWMLLGGRTAEARALEPALAKVSPSAGQRLVLGRLALVTGAHANAELLLADAWRRRDCADLALAARIAGQRASLSLMRRGVDAAAWARRALRIHPGTAASEHLSDILLLCLAAGGRFREAEALAALLPDRTGLESCPRDGLVGRGVLRLWQGNAMAARIDLADTVAAFQRDGVGPVHLRLIALAALADAEFRVGEWDQSLAHSRLALAAAKDAEQRWLLGPLHAVSCYVHAGRGKWGRAAAHARAARAFAATIGDVASAAYAAGAFSLVASARGDAAGVAAAVEPLLLTWPRADLPGLLPLPELYVDALIELGRCKEAERQLARYEEDVHAREQPALQASAWRLRGALEAARKNAGAAEAAYAKGLAVCRGDMRPLEQAKLEVGYGSLLRRLGRRADAAATLTVAQHRLTALGAQPFLERCERELRACGTTGNQPNHGNSPHLTCQEQAVATLVAAGYSNREAAGELVLSVKTVEYHLGNVFSKLGIRSRSQLILAMPELGGKT